ncbi:MAG: tryptophan synthase alpha chain [Acidimicrobiales bacterium]|jgi:tryptophan synthase alpha chain
MSATGPASDVVTATVEPARSLEANLREKRDGGRKLLLPYVTAGIVPDWLELVEAVIEAGADAVEIGIPFSDPAMDGPTIQEASVQALNNGITPAGALAALEERPMAVPLLAMTYYNLVFRYGHDRFAADLARSGVNATILPDLPVEEAGDWMRAAAENGIENVLLVAPVTSDDRLAMLAEQTKGFLYSVSTMGTTGERTSLDDAASILSSRVRAVSDVPVLIGFGISTPAHAVAACQSADGVITASALMRRVLEGASIDETASLVAEMRTALDAAF